MGDDFEVIGTIRVTGDGKAQIDQVKNSLGSVEQSTQSLGGSTSSLGNIMNFVWGGLIVKGIEFAGQQVMNFGKSFIDAYNDAEKAGAQLDAVLKSTGGVAGVTKSSVLGLAESFSRVTPYEKDAVVAGENMLLTFTNIGKDVFPDATKAILDMSTAMGSDLQGTAIQVGKALQDPVQGVSALQRVGVRLTDSQKELVKQMVAVGDTAGAQKLILKELQTEFGGSAEAAGQTFAGKLKILQNRMKDLQELIGSGVVPILTELMDDIILPLVPLVEEAGKAFGRWLNSIGSVDLKKSLGDLSSFFAPLIRALSDMMTLFAKSGPMFNSFGRDLQKFFTDLAQTAGPDLVESLTNVVKSISAFWAEHGKEIVTFFEVLFKVLVAVVSGALSLIIGIVSTAIDLIDGILSLFNDVLTGNWGKAWEDLKTMASRVWRDLGAGLKGFFDSIAVLFGSSWTKTAAAWQSAWNSLVEILRKVVLIIAGAISSWITEMIHSILTFFDPSNLKKIAEDAFTAMKTAIETVWNTIISVLQGALASVSSVISSVLDPQWMFRVASDFFDALGSGISQAVSGVYSIASNAARSILSSISSTLGIDQFFDLGKNIFGAISGGIQSVLDGIIRKVVDATQAIIDAIKALLGISSPSKVFVDVGVNMMKGWEKGIGKGLSLPVNAVTLAGSAMIAAGSRAVGDVVNDTSFSNLGTIVINAHPDTDLTSLLRQARRYQVL